MNTITPRNHIYRKYLWLGRWFILRKRRKSSVSLFIVHQMYEVVSLVIQQNCSGRVVCSSKTKQPLLRIYSGKWIFEDHGGWNVSLGCVGQSEDLRFAQQYLWMVQIRTLHKYHADLVYNRICKILPIFKKRRNYIATRCYSLHTYAVGVKLQKHY